MIIAEGVGAARATLIVWSQLHLLHAGSIFAHPAMIFHKAGGRRGVEEEGGKMAYSEPKLVGNTGNVQYYFYYY